MVVDANELLVAGLEVVVGVEIGGARNMSVAGSVVLTCKLHNRFSRKRGRRERCWYDRTIV